MSAEDGDSGSDRNEGDALVTFLLENRTLMNYASIIMIIFAVWATIESITNAFGMTWWPPETGIPAKDLYNNPDNVQNINNGWVIGLGAMCGTIGFMLQYFYRAAPYVDASMTATAALILQQATGGIGGGASEEEVIAKAEVAATIAADTMVRQTNEETIEQAKETAEAAAQAVVEEMIAAVQDKVEEVADKVESAAVVEAAVVEEAAVEESAEAEEPVVEESAEAEEPVVEEAAVEESTEAEEPATEATKTRGDPSSQPKF
tara:strand:+ start:1409 stop:2194 length:786 start_codon:yes stop_codon:yes gene_type:complete